MLDLPLRPGERQGELPFGPDRLRGPGSGGAPAPPPRPRGAQARRSNKRWLWIVAAILVLLVMAYLVLWPKPPRPSFSADPFVMDQVRIGEAGELQTLSVTNVGERPMPISVLGLSGGDLEEFTIAEDQCGARILEPQATCSLQLRFTPLGLGVRQTSLELRAQMPDSPARLQLRGEGTAPVMVLTPTSGEFGPQDVGSTSPPLDLRVGNQGTAPLAISRVALDGVAQRDFRLTRNDCSKSNLSPGETCLLRVVFVPRAAGPREAELILASDALEPVPTLDLTGEGVWTGAAFSVEPRSVEFGRRLVGEEGSKKSVQVINRQGVSLRNIRVELADRDRGFRLGNQTCTAKALAPGDSCQIEVAFTPVDEGEFDSLLEISQQNVGTLGIELLGRGVVPRWVLSTEALEFGDVRVETESGALPVELRNEGSAGSRVTDVEIAGADAAGFRITKNQCSGQDLQPDKGCGLEVRFRPRRGGEHRVELLLRMAAGRSPQRVLLVGRAIAPRLSLDREMVEFSRVHQTTMSQVELGLSNRGTAVLELRSLAVADSADGEFRIMGGSCVGSGSLAVGERCSVSIGFAPLSEGRATARLLIEHDGISGPREVPLAGIGLPPPIPKLILEVSVLDFGPQPIGNRSTIQTVNVSAGGTGNLVLREFTLQGPDAGDFRIVPATCHAGPSLQPGTTCAVGLRFLPSAAGPRSAQLVLRHNAGSGVDTIELRGEGLGGPPI